MFYENGDSLKIFAFFQSTYLFLNLLVCVFIQAQYFQQCGDYARKLNKPHAFFVAQEHPPQNRVLKVGGSGMRGRMEVFLFLSCLAE